MPHWFDAELAQQLAQRRHNDLYRQRLTIDSACQPVIRVQGQSVLQFCSNDYLGLANHPTLQAAFCKAASNYGVGSGASHLVSGHSQAHHDLEQALANVTGRDRALLFSTGFMANTGTIQALAGKGDAVFEDKLNHASLIDAGLHCGASFNRYLHNDVNSLEHKLAASNSGRKFVISDAVFSMDGDCAPVPALVERCQQQQAVLMLDDAHGFGVLNQGQGFAIHDQQAVPIYMATLGKALGGFGAFVAGSEQLIEALIQLARPYIYTTAIPPAVAAANLAALNVMQQESWRQQHLTDMVTLFKELAHAADFCLMPSTTAIQPLVLGNAARAMAYSQSLREQHILVTAIRPPTVPPNTARLRITLTAAHTEADVRRLVKALVVARKQVDV